MLRAVQRGEPLSTPAYTVRRSDRARRIRVTVDPERGVQVTLPRRARMRDAEAAVAELAPWIERRLADVDAARAAVAARGDAIPFLGGTVRAVPEPGRSRVHRRGGDLLVPAGDAGPAIERWLRRAARDEIVPRAHRAAAALGREVARVTIRDQRTRWGSCSSTGALSFSWRLVLAPEEVLDYVVWHEACHLRHMDHSPRFWGLVAQHCPGYEAPRRWLREHGATLRLGGGVSSPPTSR
jgi:predicted metal-dependent hydrolase